MSVTEELRKTFVALRDEAVRDATVLSAMHLAEGFAALAAGGDPCPDFVRAHKCAEVARRLRAIDLGD